MSVSPVESLQALIEGVGGLTDQHPKNPMASVPRAETQIPWICRTLDEAASALRTKKDPFGNPITSEQVVSGLRKLVEYIRDPSYGTLMEMAYPGIDKPLQESVDELERIIPQIVSR